MTVSRRELLGAAAATSAVLALPRWFPAGSARADDAAEGPAPRPRRTVVLLHLVGGNDGLNTVIPYREPRYRRLRPTIGVDPGRVLEISATLGLHPSLAGFEALWRRERLAIVNGLGYPQPDYSHFRSTEIWHTAEPGHLGRTGWLGRALDALPEVRPLEAVALAKEPPLCLHGERPAAATLSDFRRFRLPAGLADVAGLYAEAAAGSGPLAEVGRRGRAALDVAARIARLPPVAPTPTDPLRATLDAVATLLEADLGLQAIHATFDGFDTHANEARLHAELLQALGTNVERFQSRLESRGIADRVVTFVYSEFGRRPEENASGGTDHGHAAPGFVVGTGLVPGFHGEAPSLADLAVTGITAAGTDDGNLRHTTDFRRVYAALLQHALGLDPAALVGPHEPLPLFA